MIKVQWWKKIALYLLTHVEQNHFELQSWREEKVGIKSWIWKTLLMIWIIYLCNHNLAKVIEEVMDRMVEFHNLMPKCAEIKSQILQSWFRSVRELLIQLIICSVWATFVLVQLSAPCDQLDHELISIYLIDYRLCKTFDNVGNNAPNHVSIWYIQFAYNVTLYLTVLCRAAPAPNPYLAFRAPFCFEPTYGVESVPCFQPIFGIQSAPLLWSSKY